MPASAETETAILHLLDELDRFARAGDVEGQRSLFVDDADVALIGSAGFEEFLGHAALDGYFDLVRRHGAHAWYAWTTRRVWEHGDVAWAYADGEFTSTFDRHTDSVRYRLTVVCVRRGDAWRIALFHGSEPSSFESPDDVA